MCNVGTEKYMGEMYALCLRTDMNSSEWAAWTQAIGTIIAVFTGVGMAWWQNHQSKKLEIARNVEKIRAVAMLVRISAEAVEHWRDYWKSSDQPCEDTLRHYWWTFQFAAEELKRLGIEQVLYAKVVDEVIQAKECVRQISDSVGSGFANAPTEAIVSVLIPNIHDLYHHEECIHAEARRISAGLSATNTDDA